MIHLLTLLQVIRLLIGDLFYFLWYFKPRETDKYVKQTNGIVRRYHKFDNQYIQVSCNRYLAAFTHKCEARVDLGRECKACKI